MEPARAVPIAIMVPECLVLVKILVIVIALAREAGQSVPVGFDAEI